MKAPVCRRSAYAFVRLGLLVLIFACAAHSPAAAQNPNCPGCVVIFAGDDTPSVSHACFTNNRSESSCPANPFSLHIWFGQTVDFFQPNAQTFNFHTATSGPCCSGTDGYFNTGNMTSGHDYTVTFDGHFTAGGNLNAQTYNYYCIPHGNMMRGSLIVDPDTTTTTVAQTFGSNPSVFGQTLQFTATVSNNIVGITPTGWVVFRDFGVAISGFLSLNGFGQATYSTSVLSAGSHSITVDYFPNIGNFSASSSGALGQQVNQASTSVNLSNGSPNPSVVNQPVNSFTVTVTNTSGTGVTPSGQAQLLIDGVPVPPGYVALSSGSVTFNGVTFSSGGSHNVTAQYQDPNGNFASNTSNTVVQQVRDFSINITNPSGAALPGQNYDYTGTLTAINGYPAAVNITCTNGSSTPPNTCVLFSPSNPVPMGSAFTVRASHPSLAPTFSFNIQAASTSGFSDVQTFPVTLNIGNFSLSTLNPSSVSAFQGNASNTTAFSVSSLGAFAGPITMSCSPQTGVSCFFSNGAATHVLGLGAGQTVNDTLTLNTSSTLGTGGYTITVQASPNSGPSQTRNLTLNESTGTRANTSLSFGASTTGTNFFPSNPPQLLLLGAPFSFTVSAINEESTVSGLNSTNVNLTVVFAEPFKSGSGTVPFGPGSCSPAVNSVEITCSLGTITAAAPYIKTVKYNIVPLPGRTLDFTVFMTETNLNQTINPTHQSWTTSYRYRPMLRPALKPGNTNPK